LQKPRDFVRHPIADYLGLNETVAIDGDIILRQIVRVARSLNVWTWHFSTVRGIAASPHRLEVEDL